MESTSTDSTVYSGNCRSTRQQKIRFRWVIHNFDYSRLTNSEFITSSLFSSDNDISKSEWCIILYPQGVNNIAKNNLSVYVQLSSTSNSSKCMAAGYSFYILNDEYDSINIKNCEEIKIFQEKDVHGFDQFIDLDSLNNIVSKENTLTIVCDVNVNIEYHEYDFSSRATSSVETVTTPLKITNIPISESWSASEFKADIFRFDWVISNALKQGHLKSPFYCINVNGIESHWILEFFPDVSNDIVIKLSLYDYPSKYRPLDIKVKLQACGEKGTIFYTQVHSGISDDSNYGILTVKRTDFEHHTSRFLPMGGIEIVAQLVIYSNSIETPVKSNKLLFNSLPYTNLCQDLALLYDTKKYTDITILVKNVRMEAHRGILAVRSSILDKMVIHSLSDAITNFNLPADTSKSVQEQIDQLASNKSLNVPETRKKSATPKKDSEPTVVVISKSPKESVVQQHIKQSQSLNVLSSSEKHPGLVPTHLSKEHASKHGSTHGIYKKSDRCTLEITDYEPQVIDEMLKFIYSGVAPNADKYAEKLLDIAHKFQLPTLKFQCEEKLSMRVNIKNAAHLVEIANIYNAGILKSNVLQFIFAHVNDVLASTGWLSLEKRHAAWAKEVLGIVVQNLDKPTVIKKLSY